eukprot:1760537-Amphidinium_carterae.4
MYACDFVVVCCGRAHAARITPTPGVRHIVPTSLVFVYVMICDSLMAASVIASYGKVPMRHNVAELGSMQTWPLDSRRSSLSPRSHRSLAVMDVPNCAVSCCKMPEMELKALSTKGILGLRRMSMADMVVETHNMTRGP